MATVCKTLGEFRAATASMDDSQLIGILIGLGECCDIEIELSPGLAADDPSVLLIWDSSEEP